MTSKRQMKTDVGESQRDTVGPMTGALTVAPQATSDAPSWLRVKSEIRAGGAEGPKSGGGPGEAGPPSTALSQLTKRIGAN